MSDPVPAPDHFSLTAERAFLREINDMAGLARELYDQYRSAGARAAKARLLRDALPVDEEDGVFVELTNAQLKAQQDAFIALEALLVALGRLSLLFDSPDAGCSERSAYLRAVMNVEAGEPLLRRKFRNDWMHFDQRLEAALMAGTDVELQRFQRNAEFDPTAAARTARYMEVDSGVVYFFGARLDLEPIAVRLAEIESRAKVEHRRAIHRWPGTGHVATRDVNPNPVA